MSATAASGLRRRVRVRVQGTVQGVGFRPYVYRLAGELELAGYVLNDSHGVLAEVEGAALAVAEFLVRLASEAPPLARVEQVRAEELTPAGTAGFQILASPRGGVPDAPVAPDSATCAACLAELFDPQDRRFRYPFINCTDCGPRFTIVRGVPYDRPYTTMAGFRMCASCQAEYDDPGNRRFHAQPNACARCGPAVTLIGPDGRPPEGVSLADPVRGAVRALQAGRILAIKGIGGFHLACRADSEEAVGRLRSRKHREEKPFALMVAGLPEAQARVELRAAERELLRDPARPIVLAPRRQDAPVAASVAPGSPELGVMLPYSPLHHLLLDECRVLVMTSANVSDEPIAYTDEDARERLGTLADLFLVHNRPIQTRTDDSVARVLSVGGGRRSTLLRRSRGFVPASLALPEGLRAPPLLACGAELKSTFCVARGRQAWLSHHVGDLQNLETLNSFVEGIAHFERLFAVTPELVVHDLHPDYLSTKYALEREGVALLAVQHHHAHFAACLAEHGERGPAVGAIFDGTGLGSDGTIWGGEILHGDLRGFRRVGALAPVRLPGGERAIRQPWRMAAAWLQAAAGDDPPRPDSLLQVDAGAWHSVTALARSGLASPVSTSMGRLFDAVSALCGLCSVINYEGQAAIELEAACDPLERGSLPFEIRAADGLIVLDPRPTILALAGRLAAGEAVGALASRFHHAVSEATVEACALAAEQTGSELAVLGGGVFANRRLLEAVEAGLRARGLRVLLPERLPPGDGAVALGQAAVAAAQAEEPASDPVSTTEGGGIT